MIFGKGYMEYDLFFTCAATVAMTKCMKKDYDIGTKRIIHTSTSEVYGSAQFVPINETHPLIGQSPYAASKIGADQMVLSYWHSFQTPITILRPFNTYGPRQSTRAVIPTIITQIASGQKEIQLGTTTPTRDCNFVDDTCSAFIAVSECDSALGQVINSASNFEISIENTALLIADVMNVKIEIITDKKRLRPKDSEVNRLYGDNTLLKQLTSWQAEFGELEGFRKGLVQTSNWFSNPENLSRYRPYNYLV